MLNKDLEFQNINNTCINRYSVYGNQLGNMYQWPEKYSYPLIHKFEIWKSILRN